MLALQPEAILEALEDHEVRYVLIGGLAAVLHGSTAVTNDIDLMPAPDDENLLRLGRALVSLDARLRDVADPLGVRFDPHPALLRQMTSLTMVTRHGMLDVVFAPDGIGDFADVEREAVRFELAGITVAVASLDHIIASKQAADRPKDRAVLPILLALRDEIEHQG